MRNVLFVMCDQLCRDHLSCYGGCVPTPIGEFLGDRGSGEMELFHDEVVRVPLIAVDPDGRADVTRGRHGVPIGIR